MNVAAYIADFLVRQNVRHVFGVQGSAIAKVIDEMVLTGKIEYIANYNEQGAAFCADGYSRTTENLGVAVATSGPGATNLVTGIANAQMDSIPTLFITGQEHSVTVARDNGARQNGFQDLDIVSVVRPITKYAVMVTDEKRIRYEMEKSCWSARSGRPGAALIDIPLDIQFKEIDPDELESFIPPQEEKPEFNVAPVIEKIKEAKRPVILIGGGVRLGHAVEEVRAFAGKTNIPLVSTVNALDVAEIGYGFAGVHGNLYANLAVNNADLILIFGARLGQQHVGKKPDVYTTAKIIHVDIDPCELGRVFKDEYKVRADLKTFLLELNARIASVPLPDYASWHAHIREWRIKYHAAAYLNPGHLEPVQVVEALLPMLTRDAVLACDVGQNQMWVAQGFDVKGGQRLLNSCGHGSMGYALPAAIGSKIAFPDRQTLALMGDGGLQMNVQELMLVSLKRLGVKCIVFNNNALGMIRSVHVKYYKDNFTGVNNKDYTCVDLEKLAAAYEIGYRRVSVLDDVATLKPVLADDNPYIIEIVVTSDSQLSNRYEEAAYFEKEKLHA